MLVGKLKSIRRFDTIPFSLSIQAHCCILLLLDSNGKRCLLFRIHRTDYSHLGKQASAYLSCSVPLSLSTRTHYQIPSLFGSSGKRCVLFRMRCADCSRLGDWWGEHNGYSLPWFMLSDGATSKTSRSLFNELERIWNSGKYHPLALLHRCLIQEHTGEKGKHNRAPVSTNGG